MNQRHPTRTVTDARGYEVELDQGIADLVLACWDADIRTLQCCEDYHGLGYAWLVLAAPADLARLLAVVSEHDPDESALFWRLTDHDADAPDTITPEAPGQWRYRLLATLDATHDGTGSPAACRSWGFVVSVEFPTSDIPFVTERLGSVADHRS